MKLVYQNTISRLYEKIIGNLSNVHTQDLNDFIYSAQMKGLHQFHIILQSTYMKFSYTRHIPSYTLQQCTGLALTESRLFSRQLSGGFLSAFSHNPKKSRFPWEKVKAPSLDLKILQVFFKNRGELLVFQKMLNFLSFLVLLYVSGHFKQKNFFQNFSD